MFGTIQFSCYSHCKQILSTSAKNKLRDISGSSTYIHMTYDRSTMHPKFDQTRVRTHDFQIINIFCVTETPAVITRPSVTPED